MKSFKKFAFLTALPFIIACIIIFFSESLNDIKKLLPFSVGYFAIIAFNYVCVFEKLQSKKRALFKNFLLANLAVFICCFCFGIAYSFIIDSKINFQTAFFQALLSIILLTFEFALIKIYQNYKNRNRLEFIEKPINYLAIVVVISVIETIFLSLFIIELLKADGFYFFKFCIENFLFRTLSITAFSMVFLYILSHLKFIKNNLFLIILLTILSTYASFYAFGFADFKPRIIISNLVTSFFFTLFAILTILYRNNQSATKLKIASLTNSISKKEAEYLQLKDQINPHFLFNNLNTLISFIEIEPKKAIEFGHHLSNVYRHYLKNQTEDFVSLSEELHFINEYLEIYKAKFESGFTFEIEKATSKNQYILSLSLQEIIDNIFKHNILDDENPIAITINIEKEFLAIKNSITIQTDVISNNKGLANINKRNKILLDRESSISQNPNFFEVRIPIAILEK